MICSRLHPLGPLPVPRPQSRTNRKPVSSFFRILPQRTLLTFSLSFLLGVQKAGESFVGYMLINLAFCEQSWEDRHFFLDYS